MASLIKVRQKTLLTHQNLITYLLQQIIYFLISKRQDGSEVTGSLKKQL